MTRRLLFIADGRSPIALNWIRYFTAQDWEVHLVSTFPCRPAIELASLQVIPVAFSSAVSESGIAGKRGGLVRSLTTPSVRTWLRHWLAPVTLGPAARRLALAIAEIGPQIVHAMRIPYEGMLAGRALSTPAAGTADHLPLVLSVWGNDFTLHARSSRVLGSLTKMALRRADVLHADCQRDLRLAHEWGFSRRRQGIVMPGNGGVQSSLFYPPAPDIRHMDAAEQAPIIVQPRGFRAYVQNQAFFESLPSVLAVYPQARVICPDMATEVHARRWVDRLGLEAQVALLSKKSRIEMAELFRRAWIAVSPTTHDGTPNTLLEAMACGCFPVAGDLESIREWIENGRNGLLLDPTDPRALAQAMQSAIENTKMRAASAALNVKLVRDRADYEAGMQRVAGLYRRLAG